jgi:L-lactate dehydrogenase (cytochrome)
MQDVEAVDASAVILGCPVAWPFVVGPTGMPGLIDIGGEAALARAAANSGALYVLSTMASQSIEEVAAAAPGPKAFQLYLFRDRGLTRELIERARDAGYASLILTVDVQVPANRERDKRNGMVLPPRFGPRSVFDFARRPRWCWDQLVRRPITLANFAGMRASPGQTLLEFIGAQFDPKISWADLEWVRGQWGEHLAIKGILRAADAIQAASSGASTIILSNHGGRQLDGAASPMDVLVETVDDLAGSAEVIVDGGVRRGTDMLKAIALGAAGCMSGRVGLYGLAAEGPAGASLAFELLRSEFLRDMALLGANRLSAISSDCVMRVATRQQA